MPTHDTDDISKLKIILDYYYIIYQIKKECSESQEYIKLMENTKKALITNSSTPYTDLEYFKSILFTNFKGATCQCLLKAAENAKVTEDQKDLIQKLKIIHKKCNFDNGQIKDDEGEYQKIYNYLDGILNLFRNCFQ